MNPYEFTLSLRVRHPKMTCHELSSVIGLTPKFSQDIGDDRQTPKGRKLEGKYDETYCSFELEGKTNGSIEDYIRKWCHAFDVHRGALKQIRQEGGKLEFFVGVFLSENAGIELTAEDFASMAGLGLNVSFDFYSY